MAMNVSLAANAKPHDRRGQVDVRRFRYTGPASYATNGDSADGTTGITTFGLGAVVSFPSPVALDASAATPHLVVWIPSTRKVKWFVVSSGLEVANGTDLSAYTCECVVEGY